MSEEAGERRWVFRLSRLVCPPPHAEVTPVAGDPAKPDEPFFFKNFIYGKLKKKKKALKQPITLEMIQAIRALWKKASLAFWMCVWTLFSHGGGGKKTGTDLVDADSKFSGKTAYLSGGYERLRGGKKCNFSRSNCSLLFFFNYLVLRSVPQRCERGGAGTPRLRRDDLALIR